MASAWEITREMFLAEDETDMLLDLVRTRARRADAGRRTAAVLDRLIIESLLFSGLRNSELCRLRLADTVVGTGRPVFVVQGTPRQDRTVYVPGCVSELVTEYAATVRPDSLPDGVSTSDLNQPLIFNERRRPFERTGLYRRVVRILTAAGFGQRASVQLLRHTYGYLAYKRSGGNLLFVQRQLGHAHPVVTSVYAQFVEEQYDEIAERIGPSSSPSKRRRKQRK